MIDAVETCKFVIYHIADVCLQVKEIEKRDSVLTPKQQIERLLRPGSTYFNLNPFEVLQVDPSVSLDEAKKKYRRLSILVHPDKNQDDPDRAQLAFDSKCMHFFVCVCFLRFFV